MNYTIKNEKNSRKEIEVTVNKDDFAKYFDAAFKIIQKEVEVDGFRKGLAPLHAIIGKYGESAIMQEMANQAINTTYVEIVLKEKLHIISEPHIHIVKLAKDSEFVYHAHVTVFPEVNVGNYKEIAKKTASESAELKSEVTQEEINAVLSEIDEEVKTSTPDLENKIRENFKLEKELNNKNILRSKYLEEMLKDVNSTNENAWPEEFTDRDKAQIIAVQIAKTEGLNASPEEIDVECIKLSNIIPKQDIISGKVDENRIREYAAQIVINEKMFKSIGL